MELPADFLSLGRGSVIALEQHRKQLEIEERHVQEIQMQNEMKIMETDTTGMDPLSATYWNNLKIEVMKKRGFNFYLLFIMLLLFFNL